MKILILSLLLSSSVMAQFPFSSVTGEWLSTNASGGVNAGYYAGSAVPESDAIRIGFFAGAGAEFSGLSAVAIGRHAGNNAMGQQSVFLGHAAGQYAGLGGDASGAVVLGYLAARNTYEHRPHYAFGAVILGASAGANSHSSQVATMVGGNAGTNATHSVGAVMMGYGAGYNATSAAGSVLLGQYAGALATNAVNSVYIGNQAGYSLSRDSTLVIEGNPAYGQAGATGLIYGEFDNRVLRFNASQMGFLGAAASPRQTVTGSRSDGSALASLLQALALFGFITDTTTP